MTMTNKIRTRFAPSPTGFLHIGGVRTALFNWLFAQKNGGEFLLRIEDTDKERSTDEAVKAIIDGLDWIGLGHDGDIVYQSHNVKRHQDVAQQLLDAGYAYRCYCTPEELSAMREKARIEKTGQNYDRRWRDKTLSDAPGEDVPFSVRIKAPLDGKITIHDQVQEDVTIDASQLDDFIILRSDGTPTYLLSVVVDDHDMEITHVIRGDDHLNNAFRQKVIFDAMGWDMPSQAHIPLIHGPDGKKLSKRHGALGVEFYRDAGYLPEAMLNYLSRLGWSYKNEEIYTMKQAMEWFELSQIGKSASRIDFDKMAHVNGVYIDGADVDRLVTLLTPFFEKRLGYNVGVIGHDRLAIAMGLLKNRAKTLLDMVDQGLFLVQNRPMNYSEKAQKFCTKDHQSTVKRIRDLLSEIERFEVTEIKEVVNGFCEENHLKLGKVGGPIRVALTGSTASPSVFDIMPILGYSEVMHRLDDFVNAAF